MSPKFSQHAIQGRTDHYEIHFDERELADDDNDEFDVDELEYYKPAF